MPPATPVPPGRLTLGAAAAAVFAVTFLFRFLSVGFVNDHFMHLAQAQQVLMGEHVLRDFFDFGLPLQIYLSAAVLSWSGHNLAGEALLSVGFIAAGAALTFVVAALVSRSTAVALAVTATAVLLAPRLYAYPKVSCYVLALALAWRYAHRPDRRHVVWLSAGTALAFLLRHDHGAYIGMGVVALFAAVHLPDVRTALRHGAAWAAVTGALLLPFLVYVQLTAGLVHYVTNNLPHARPAATVRVESPPFSIDRTQPLLAMTPPLERRIHVRWMAGLDDEVRTEREAFHQLASPLRVDGLTWSYVPSNPDPPALRALVNDPAVADTHGIDRPSGELEVRETLAQRLQRWLPPLRAQVLPGVLHAGNALAWLYYLSLVLPVLVGVVLVRLVRQGRIARPDAAVVGVAALMSLVTVQTIVRGSPDTRLPDVAGQLAVIGAWLLARPWRPTDVGGWAWRRVGAAGVAVLLVTVWSTVVYTGGVGQAAGRLLQSPANLWASVGSTYGQLRTRPIESFDPEDRGIPGLTRYVFECTSENDRVFVTWFAPEIFFNAERRFAGGHSYLSPGWHASRADQELTVAKLREQRVPIVLTKLDLEDSIREHFPLVHQYVSEQYALFGEFDLDGYAVLADRAISPEGTYEPFGLPCYR